MHGWSNAPGHSKASPFHVLYTELGPPQPCLPDDAAEYRSALVPRDPPRLEELHIQPDDAAELYLPLRDSSWFRLFSIEPGAFGDPLCCRLARAHRDTATLNYEALSYAWGEQNLRGWREYPAKGQYGLLVCNGQTVTIQANLWEALQRLRLPDRQRILWIDALCINQVDGAEKSAQVAAMDQIYSQAANVIVWLGEQSGSATRSGLGTLADQQDDIERAFRLVCKLVIAWDDKLPASFEVCDEASGFPRTCRPETALVAESLTPDDWGSLRSLFGRSWFTRRWVIQEVARSRASDVVWGSCKIAWNWVGLCAAILRTQYDSYCREFDIRGVYGAYFIFRLCRQGSPHGLPFAPFFLHLLRLAGGFESSNPLDQVYALLGVAARDNKPDQEPFITPDYTLSEPELCKRVAEKLITATDSSRPLKFLCDAEDSRWTSKIEWTRRGRRRGRWTAPSWIPRWEKAAKRIDMLCPWTFDDAFSPSKGVKFRRYPAASTACLRVHGVELSTILWCNRSLSEGWGAPLRVLDLLSSGAFGDFTPAAGSIPAFARTLCAGRDGYGSRIKDGGDVLSRQLMAHLSQEPGWAGQWPLDQSGSEDVELFRRTSAMVCRGRVLFVTASGHLGLGSALARPGDAVCILGGADMPFILRPSALDAEDDEGSGDEGDWTRGEDEKEGGFRLIGECYVDGIMEGEAVAAMHRGEGHRGPFDAKLVARTFYKLEHLTEHRAAVSMLISKALELAEKKYEKLEASPISIW